MLQASALSRSNHPGRTPWLSRTIPHHFSRYSKYQTADQQMRLVFDYQVRLAFVALHGFQMIPRRMLQHRLLDAITVPHHQRSHWLLTRLRVAHASLPQQVINNKASERKRNA